MAEPLEVRFDTRRPELTEAMFAGGRAMAGWSETILLWAATIIVLAAAGSGAGAVAVLLWRWQVGAAGDLPTLLLPAAAAIVFACHWVATALPWRLLAARMARNRRLSGEQVFRADAGGVQTAGPGALTRVDWAAVDAVRLSRSTLLVIAGGLVLYAPRRALADPEAALARLHAWRDGA